MKKILALLLLSFATVSAASAQNHGEAGIFGEYFRFGGFDTNHVGLGGRLGFNVHKNIQLEAELSYLFRRGFAENFSNGVPGQVGTAKSNLRILHGLFGPKFQLSGRFRPFVVLKGGFFNTEINGQSPGVGFTSQINNLRANRVSAVLYPGAGVEHFFGPIGLRFDAGDEIIFNNGANHNLRLTFGPQIRF